MKRLMLCALSLAIVGCADDAAPPSSDTSVEVTPDAEISQPETDTSSELEVAEVLAPDAEVADVEVAAEVSEVSETVNDIDAGPEVPLPGFGIITGACGFVAAELDSDAPSLYVNHYDFGADPYDASDLDKLTEGSREMLRRGNAGGSSILSEVFAFEMLARCDGAVLLKTETEVVYDVPAKITDMIVEIDGKKVGANPTRAIGFPFDAPYTVAQAKTILEKKLGDILSSSETVSAEDRWVKQVLTVFAYADSHVEPVEAAWESIDPALRANTIVIVTVTDGDDQFIYTN